MSSLISSIQNPFYIPESPVPNKEDMFCRNAPKLKDVPLCLFLQKMDEQEQEIQDRKCRTIQPDEFKKRVKLVESELTIEKYKSHRLDHPTVSRQYGVISALAFTALFSVLTFGIAVPLHFTTIGASIPVLGASGTGWGVLSTFSKKKELAKDLSIVECLNPETGNRLERLKEKCCSLAKELLSLDEGEVDSEDSNEKQILAVSEFFLKNIDKYEKIYEKCPKETSYSYHPIIGFEKGRVTTKTIDPNTGEVTTLDEDLILRETSRNTYYGPYRTETTITYVVDGKSQYIQKHYV